MEKRKTKIKCSEGDIFLIPIGQYYYWGVLARVNKNIGLGYFFNRKTPIDATNEHSVMNLDKVDVVLIKIFSTIAIQKGLWPILSKLKDWDRTLWADFVFKRKDAIEPNAVHKVFYNEELEEIKTEYYTKDPDIEKYPADGLAGYGWIEKKIISLVP